MSRPSELLLYFPWLDDSREDDVATLQIANVEKSCKGTIPAVIVKYDGHEFNSSIYSVFRGKYTGMEL